MPSARLLLHERVDPLATEEEVLQACLWQATPLPIYGYQVDRHRVSGAAHVALRRKPDVEVAAMQDHGIPSGDGLSIRTADRRLHGQGAAALRLGSRGIARRGRGGRGDLHHELPLI